jgi:hypothetical protein
MISDTANECLVAAWGATARREETRGSDRDLLIWAPNADRLALERMSKDIELAQLKVGTYVDILKYDRAKTLEEWAQSTASDFQAMLFAEPLSGDARLIETFLATQERLWANCTLRAREVWLLSCEVLQRPLILSASRLPYRPEKFEPGATRSFTALAELWTMITASRKPVSTQSKLKQIEIAQALRPGTLANRYQLAMAAREAVERGDSSTTFSKLWRTNAEVVVRAQAKLVATSLPWLQQHAGISPRWSNAHLEAIDGHQYIKQAAATPNFRLDDVADSMMRAFYTDSNDLHKLLDEAPVSWHTAFAATANTSASADSIDLLVRPRHEVDPHAYRNIWLWALRHPNISCSTLERFLRERGHRDMDYESARNAQLRCGA